MHAFSVDYADRDGRGPGCLVNRGFWLNGTPRLMPVCRMFGHRPVVDGVDMTYQGRPHWFRWVVCDRCGVRPDPQGSLDDDLVVGQPYTGGYSGALVVDDSGKPQPVGREPGPWPAKPTGTIGGQVVIGGHYPGPSVEVKVGNGGSEHTLAAHLDLGRLGVLYLHTEQHGRPRVRPNVCSCSCRVTVWSSPSGIRTVAVEGPRPLRLAPDRGRAGMSEAEGGAYELVMPFVVCQSQGGPYEDEAFVAGWRLGQLDRTLEHDATLDAPADPNMATVHPAEMPLVDLIAMKHGYTVVAVPWSEAPGDWLYVEFQRAGSPADPDSTDPGGS